MAKKRQYTATVKEIRAAVPALKTLMANERLGTVTMFRLSELARALEGPSESAQNSINKTKRRFVSEHEDDEKQSEIMEAEAGLEEEIEELLQRQVKIKYYPIPATALVLEDEEDEDRTYIPGGASTLLGLRPFLTDLDQLEDF